MGRGKSESDSPVHYNLSMEIRFFPWVVHVLKKILEYHKLTLYKLYIVGKLIKWAF